MEAPALSALESYDYEKWNGSMYDSSATQGDYSSPVMMRPSQSSFMSNQWAAVTNEGYSPQHVSSVTGLVSGQDPYVESDQAIFSQAFYSDSAWGSTAPAADESSPTNHDQGGSPSNIWASPNKSSDDADALLTNWNQQCRLTESPQQQDGRFAQDLSQSRSSSTEVSGVSYQDAFYGPSPTSQGNAPSSYLSGGAHHVKSRDMTTASMYPHGPPNANGFAYFNQPATPTSVPGLYGASSGSTNTNSTTTFSWQPPPAASTNLSTPVFSRSRSAPVGFDTHTPTVPYSNDRRHSLLDNSSFPRQDPSVDQSHRTGALLEPNSQQAQQDEYNNASPRQQTRRGARAQRGRKYKQQQQQQHRYSLGSTGSRPRGSPPSYEHEVTRRTSFGSTYLPTHPYRSDPMASSVAIRQLMKPGGDLADSSHSTLDPSFLTSRSSNAMTLQADNSPNSSDAFPILPLQPPPMDDLSSYYYDDVTNSYSEEDDALFVTHDLDASEFDPEGEDLLNEDSSNGMLSYGAPGGNKNRDWLSRMNRKLQETPVGKLDPAVLPLQAVMNVWAKTKSAQGASMVEMWLKRVLQEHEVGNERVVPTTKMFTMAVDAWARSGEGGAAAQRAEGLLQQMHDLFQSGKHDSLRPTTGMFNAVINAWTRSREKGAPARAEQILDWMQKLKGLDVQPDKYTFNTVIHSYAKAGSAEAANKAQELLQRMHQLYKEGNALTKPDTITYNVVINAFAKAGRKGAVDEAEKLLAKMHHLHATGDPDVKPNVVTYGAVIDCFAKSGEPDAASRADTLLANMIQLYQSDPIQNACLMPNTYVFNTVINCWSKSKHRDSASKAEEMLVAMSRLHASGMPTLKPDAFTYTAVIDAWAKSGLKGAASRADQLLDKMEAKYLAGDMDLKPNTFTYNAVINALAKSGDAGAAARAERVLANMVNRHRNGAGDDVKPTTINFNTVLDAWAKSGGGRVAAERAEEILEWMDRLHKSGNTDVKPDTITFNAVLDSWARSGDHLGPRRAEQILDHMDELYRAGNQGVKPDTYTYNTLINALAKSGQQGAAARAEYVLNVMEKRYNEGDPDIKPNTRTHTSVIDCYAKSGVRGAARRAEQILNNMRSRYDATRDPDIKPNVHTANAVCNACAFSKKEEDRTEALQIAFRVFDWLSNQTDMEPDSYTYTILLSVCANLIPREDGLTRFAHARAFFDSCRDTGYVNDYVLRKLRQTVTDDEYLGLVEYRTEPSASSMPYSWTRNVKLDVRSKGRRATNGHVSHGGDGWSNRRRGK